MAPRDLSRPGGGPDTFTPDRAIQEPDHLDPPHGRGLSLFLGEVTDASIILAIVLASGLLGFGQEWGAADALKKLLALVQTKASVLRDGQPVDVPSEQVVPGDVVLLHAGDIIPGDGRILDESDLFVAEATLTGETFPVEKAVGAVPPDSPLARRTNCVFLGTSVVSGTARLLVVRRAGIPNSAGSPARFGSGPRRPGSSAASAASATSC